MAGAHPLWSVAAVLTLLGGCVLPADFIKVDDDGSGGDGPRPPSCAADDEVSWHCGPNFDTDCCETLLLPDGVFKRSYDGEPPWDDDRFEAHVSPFYLDTYEVTVGRFRAFVEAESYALSNGEGAHPGEVLSGWNEADNAFLPADADELHQRFSDCEDSDSRYTWEDIPVGDDQEVLPITCVDWYLAFSFCVWDGGRLPSEAEWNYAAAGGSAQRKYPWGDEAPNASLAVWGAEDNEPQPVGSTQDNGAGLWNHADLAGNVAEWTLDQKDWTDDNGNPTGASYDVECDDCVEVDDPVDNPENKRAIRGGVFFTVDPQYLRSSYHFSFPALFQGFTGLRCARDP